MKLLALDTSSLACSVALQNGNEILESHEVQPREHTKLLAPMIRGVLRDGDVELADLDAIVLGNGPGSFIGMRIAASLAQGLAHGAGLRIVPVSSLLAVAAELFAVSDANEAIVAQDAHMNEVYLGAYRRGDDDLPELLFAERLHGHMIIDEIDVVNAERRVAAGSGWQRYPEIAAINSGLIGEPVEILHPRARFLLAMGADALQRGQSIDPADVVPAYLRHKVAEKPASREP
ncbi:MAG: tRNA (adenosine(37)-N6)-threonylcarbamoyltransferase complex dimerization subunit type 1 TsaB [Gammaproteobacteria bacterium]|nr:tRNA (adenosine(37)-N6)-threonylcarbamoyltransferase complex dimerization subunit type 1 TsaB [Gammaproteobacteria bacterium]